MADAAVRRNELVLDLGAGTGSLTAALLAAGARVLAVELHPGRAAVLRRRFADRASADDRDGADCQPGAAHPDSAATSG